MKHPQYQRHHNYSVEWLQAMFTLMILVWIYVSMPYFNSYETALTPKPEQNSSISYWNESLWYGFQWWSWYVYNPKSTQVSDIVQVQMKNGTIYNDSGVKVSFYTNTPIDQVEKKHDSQIPRTYSRLPNGIAVIEWDLASPVAKNILATLHSR